MKIPSKIVTVVEHYAIAFVSTASASGFQATIIRLA